MSPLKGLSPQTQEAQRQDGRWGNPRNIVREKAPAPPKGCPRVAISLMAWLRSPQNESAVEALRSIRYWRDQHSMCVCMDVHTDPPERGTRFNNISNVIKIVLTVHTR